MDFGETILKKYGWKEGQGLGRDEGGIKTAIKPKLKFNNIGLGYDQAEEFTFHWWDHVYNKKAKNLVVKKNEEGEIHISRDEDVQVSTKRKKKKNKYTHGSFVKAAVLQGSAEIPEKDANTTQEPEESFELIKTLTDEQLFASCGGLTAHKAARHGHTMSAKLSRLEQQEREFVPGRVHRNESDVQDILNGSTERSSLKKAKVQINKDILKESDNLCESNMEGPPKKSKTKHREKDCTDCQYVEANSDLKHNDKADFDSCEGLVDGVETSQYTRKKKKRKSKNIHKDK